MKRSLFALFAERAATESVIEQLKASGIAAGEISLLFAERAAQEPPPQAPEGGPGSAGSLGWLAGIGALAIPGLGPFTAAGPLKDALIGAAVGTAVGGITGALVGMGVPEYEARHYEAQIRAGKWLLSVHREKGEPVEQVLQILRDAKAEEIATSGEAGAQNSPEPPKKDPPSPPPPGKGDR